MPAQPTPNGYRSFPPEYFSVLERVERLGHAETFRIGPFDKKDAQSGRRSFYRFRNALNEEGEKGDSFASEQANIANLLKLEIADEPDGFYIVFALNPIVAAVRRLTEEELTASKPTPKLNPVNPRA